MGVIKLIDCTDSYTIYAHKETGVMYFCYHGYNTGCAVCVMVCADGKPCIYKEAENGRENR